MAILSMSELTEEQRVYYTSLMFRLVEVERALTSPPPPEITIAFTPWQKAKRHLDEYLYECSCECHEDEDY